MWLAVDALVLVAFWLSLRRAAVRSEARAAVASAALIAGLCELTRIGGVVHGAFTTTVVAILLGALRLATLSDQRAHGLRAEERRRAAARAELARGLREGIDDSEVEEAWDVVCHALEQGWLTGAADVAALIDALERGSGRQLMEEASIDVDDEVPDRVALYDIGLSPSHRTCARAPLLVALGRLAPLLAAP